MREIGVLPSELMEVGDRVVYVGHARIPNTGTVTGIDAEGVWVLYDGNTRPKVTLAQFLRPAFSEG